jgi:hypothetical protein
VTLDTTKKLVAHLREINLLLEIYVRTVDVYNLNEINVDYRCTLAQSLVRKTHIHTRTRAHAYTFTVSAVNRRTDSTLLLQLTRELSYLLLQLTLDCDIIAVH